MKKAKKKQIPIIENERQLQLLEKYFDIDREHKLASITLCYEKATDIIVTELGDKMDPLFDTDVLTRVNNIIESVPVEYGINLAFEIEDYEGYEADRLLASFKDALELNQFKAVRETKKKALSTTFMIMAGVAVLTLSLIGAARKWFGEGTTATVIAQIIEIAGWVFIWQATTLAFLDHSEVVSTNLRIKKRVKTLSFRNKGDKEPLAFETAEHMFGHWENESQAAKLGKTTMLASSAGLLVSSAWALYSGIIRMFDEPFGDVLTSIFYVIFLLANIGFYVFGGLSGIMHYTDKRESWLYRYAIAFSVVTTIISIIAIVLTIMSGKMGYIGTGLLGTLASFGFRIGLLLEKYGNRRKAKSKANKAS